MIVRHYNSQTARVGAAPRVGTRLRFNTVGPIRAQTQRTPSFEVLEAFHYGRALAIVISQRAGEAFSDVISEISKAIAERDTRLKDFQDEVVALAQKEMYDGNVPAAVTAANSSTDTSNSQLPMAPIDVEAIVDDLRAEIASSRAMLQQIRAEKS